MPSTSLNCFTLLPVALLLGGASPAAGQNNVFANRRPARRAELLLAISRPDVLGPYEQQQHAGASHGCEPSWLPQRYLRRNGNDLRQVARLMPFIGLCGHVECTPSDLSYYGQSAIYQQARPAAAAAADIARFAPAPPPAPPYPPHAPPSYPPGPPPIPPTRNFFPNRAGLFVLLLLVPIRLAVEIRADTFGYLASHRFVVLCAASWWWDTATAWRLYSEAAGTRVQCHYLRVRAASHPLHPSPPDTHALCLALLTIRFAECRVPSKARPLQPTLEAWDVSRVTTLAYALPLPPLHPSLPTRTRRASLCLPFALPSAEYLPRGEGLQPKPRGVGRLEGHDLGTRQPLILSPASPTASHRHGLPYSLPFLSDARLPSLTRSPSLPHRLTQPVAAHVRDTNSLSDCNSAPDRLHLVGQRAVVELTTVGLEPERRRSLLARPPPPRLSAHVAVLVLVIVSLWCCTGAVVDLQERARARGQRRSWGRRRLPPT